MARLRFRVWAAAVLAAAGLAISSIALSGCAGEGQAAGWAPIGAAAVASCAPSPTLAQTVCDDIAITEKLDPGFAAAHPILTGDAAKICLFIKPGQ